MKEREWEYIKKYHKLLQYITIERIGKKKEDSKNT